MTQTSPSVAIPQLPALRNVAVLGAGLMGHAIAYVFARHGCNVRVYDSSPNALNELDSRLKECAKDCGPTTGTVAGFESLSQCVDGVELVLEAVAERLDAKQQILRAASEAAGQAVLATNTSVISIREIAAGLPDARKLVGAHWWNPAHLIDVVEVVAGPDTEAVALDRLMGWLRSVGKQPVRLGRDVPGYVGNRLQFAMWREAMKLVEAGVCDAETLDIIVRGTFGRRLAVLGPMENADYIGLDLTQSIMSHVLPSLTYEAERPPLLERLVSQGDLGAKSGRGFLSWSLGQGKATSSRLRKHLLDHAEGGEA